MIICVLFWSCVKVWIALKLLEETSQGCTVEDKTWSLILHVVLCFGFFQSLPAIFPVKIMLAAIFKRVSHPLMHINYQNFTQWVCSLVLGTSAKIPLCWMCVWMCYCEPWLRGMFGSSSDNNPSNSCYLKGIVCDLNSLIRVFVLTTTHTPETFNSCLELKRPFTER